MFNEHRATTITKTETSNERTTRSNPREFRKGHAMRFPTRGLYTYMRGDGSPFLVNRTTIDLEKVQAAAKFDHIILDVWAPKFRPDILEAFRNANPAAKLYGYCMGLVYWKNPNPALGPASEDIAYQVYKIVDETNGYVWNLDGREYSFFNINGSKWETMSRIADLYLDWIVKWQPTHWDGIFLDMLIPKLLAPPQDLDWQRLGYTSGNEFVAAWNKTIYDFVAKIRKGAPKNYPIMCNYGPGAFPDLTNGWMREDFPKQSAYQQQTNWIENAVSNYWGQEGFLSAPHIYTWNGELLYWLCTAPGYDKQNSKQRMRFGLGSATLGNCIHSFGRNEWEPNRFWWFGEYDLDLGDPLGWAYVSSNGTFSREFTKGMVVVNPQWQPKSVYFGTGPDRAFTLCIDGKPTGPRKSAFTVGARDSIFLVR